MIWMLLAACGGTEVATEAEPAAPIAAEAPVGSGGAEEAGERTTVVGTLARRPLGAGDAQGTALLTDEGGVIWLTYGEVPHGWEGLLDKRIEVEGTLWPGPPADAPRTGVAMPDPHLTDFDAPKPAP